MATSFAELVLSANTSGLRAARGDLQRLTSEGERTETRTRKALGGVGAAAKVAAGALVALGAVSWASNGIRQAREYGAAMSEVSTLIEGTPAQMKSAEVATRNFAKAYGTSATQQAKAYYQAISGGAEAGAEATMLLDTANRLAIAGVTDVASAVGILTSATNVYADSGLTAAEASDALFVAVRAGVTTIPELSASLGQVLPLAQKLGLSFDEVAAATAALTKGGINTSESVTGINAALTSIIGPSKQASDLAASLGLEFNSAALETKGFAQFMADAVEATGGGADAMRTLFGSTEATKVALALAGTAGADMAAILDDMAGKAGATDTAFGKMSEDMDQRLKVVQSRFADLQIGVGDALLTVLVPVMEKAADAATYFANAIPVEQISAAATALMGWSGIDEVAIALGALAAAAAIAASPFIAMAAAVAGVTAAGVYLYTNWEEISAKFPGITGALAAAFDLVTAAFDAIMPVAMAVGEFVVAQVTSMVAVVDAILNGDWAGAWTAAKEYVTRPLDAAVAFVVDFAANILQTIKDLASNVLTAAKEIGGNIIAGITGSIKSKAADIKNSVTSLGAGMLDGLKNKLGIQSPSKEFAKLGAHSVDGLIVGIDGKTGALVDQVTQTGEAALDSAEQTLAQGFGSMVDYMIDGFKGGMSGLVDIFKNTLRQMAATAIKNKITIGLGMGGSIGGTAAAATAPGGGILGAGGALGGLGGIGSALAGGFMNSVGGFLGGGLSGGFGAIGAQVGTAFATGTGTAIAGAIGAIAAPLLAVAAVFSFFKSKTKELDAGLRVTIDGMDTLVETFSTIEKKKFWGLSKKVSTSFTAAEASVADPLEAIVAQMQGSVLDAAGSIGVGADAYEAFAHEVQISTKGLSEEDAQRAVVEALNGIGNAFAALTPDLEQFMREGEEAGDTLTRLASDLGAVNLMMDTLGHTLREATVIGAGTASDFAAMFGGIQAMNAATTAFFTGFYSEAERFATAQRQIEAQFSALGVTTPQTRDQFRAMVDILDLTTESGRSMYASLVSLSSALDAVLPAVSSFTAQIAAMVGAISTEIDTIIGEATTAMRSNEQAAALWYRTADTLRGVITDMRSTAGALISGAKAREFSETRFQTLLASAMAGDSGAAAGLGAAARTLLDNTKATATTALEVARAEARVISDLQLAGGVSDIEGARHDVIAGLMGQQVDLLEGVRDAINSGDLSADDIDGLNAQMGALEGAIKAAEMINYAFLQERLSVSVDLIADADIPQPIRDLLANTATGITATIDYIVRAPDLTPDLRWLALTGTSSHVSTLELIADDRLTNAQRQIALLDLGADTAVLRNVVMRATYATDTTAAQRSIIDAIGGSVDGRITLGGSFQFDPSTGFQTWYATTTRAAITVPMAGLQLSLNALADQIRADMADRAAAAARAQYLAGLQAQLGTVAGTRQTAIDEAAGVMGQIRDLEARTGVDIRNGSSDAVMGFHAGGNVNYQASHVSYRSGSDLAGFNSAFRGPNGLEAQLMALGQIPAAYNQQINGLRAQIAGMGAVPAFATGGTHMGGLRMVGENGPELEVTGPSRIYSAPQTRAMMSGGDNARLEMLVEKLTMEVARMRDENTQLAKNRGTDLRRIRLIEERRAAAEELL
jgi:TP901 family phage tail tape measure protein